MFGHGQGRWQLLADSLARTRVRTSSVLECSWSSRQCSPIDSCVVFLEGLACLLWLPTHSIGVIGLTSFSGHSQGSEFSLPTSRPPWSLLTHTPVYESSISIPSLS